MADTPVISIGMPVFNAAKSLRSAVVSILLQDFQDWELLLIDDGSTDDTLAVARSFDDVRIRVLSDGVNRGLAVRLNEAVNESRGECFARMDGDDIAFPTRLAQQLTYLRAHPEVDLVGGWALVFDSASELRGRRMPPEAHEVICASPWTGFALMHPTFMARTEWFRAFPYDESLSKAQDQVLLAGTCLLARFANVQDFVLAYREDMPGAGKLWASRRCMMRGMFRAYTAIGRKGWAWRVVASQGLRMLADIPAMLPLVRRRLLSRRSGAVGAGDVERWQDLLLRIATRSSSHG